VTTIVVRVRRLLDGAGVWIDHEAEERHVPPRVARVVFIVPFVLTFTVALTIPWRPLYLAIVDEDRIIEWLQVAILLGIAACAGVIAVRLFTDGHRLFGLAYILVLVATLFIAGEEISWGQRIFGWVTPEELSELNRQGETNIHNIGITLRVFNLLLMTAAAVAVILPVAYRRRSGSRPMSFAEMALIPPLFVAPGFVIAFTYRLIRITLVPEGRLVVTHFQEVAELTFYFSTFVFVALVARRARRPAPAIPAPSDRSVADV
jgi:hypothetical protein